MLIKENKPEWDSDGGADVGLDVIPTEFPLTIKNSPPPHLLHSHPHAPTAHMPTIQTCKYVNAHINRNTPSLARVQRSQTSLLAGCDYILERGNVLRPRWGSGWNRRECFGLATSTPCPFFTLGGEFGVGSLKKKKSAGP